MWVVMRVHLYDPSRSRYSLTQDEENEDSENPGPELKLVRELRHRS